jgi:hypothetical protein
VWRRRARHPKGSSPSVLSRRCAQLLPPPQLTRTRPITQHPSNTKALERLQMLIYAYQDTIPLYEVATNAHGRPCSLLHPCLTPSRQLAALSCVSTRMMHNVPGIQHSEQPNHNQHYEGPCAHEWIPRILERAVITRSLPPAPHP